MLARTFALIVAMVLGGAVAHAQPAPAPAPQPAPPPEPAPPPAPAPAPADPAAPTIIQPPPDFVPPPPGFGLDPAWSEYDGAFRDAAAGDVKGARSRLAELASRWPGHPAEARVAAMIGPRGPRPEDRNAPSNVARGELVFWSTLGGVSLAGHLCVVIDCTTDRASAGVYTLSVGGALGLSILATRRGIRQGEAQLYNSAQTWGVWNSLILHDGFPDTAEEAGAGIAMQLGGLAGGIWLWQVWKPTQGDIALANTFLFWGTIMTVWGHLALDTEPSLRTVILVGDAALLAGVLLSREYKMSRGRTLLIDVGGILGTLAGGIVALAADSDSGAGASLLFGTGLGLAIGAFATSGWDKPPPVNVAPTVIPGPDRTAGYGLSAGFSF